jgi:hypothetical protein
MANKTHLNATLEIHGSLKQSKKKHMEIHYIEGIKELIIS